MFRREERCAYAGLFLTFSKPSAPPANTLGPSLVEAVSMSHIPGPHVSDIFTPSGSDILALLFFWLAPHENKEKPELVQRTAGARLLYASFCSVVGRETDTDSLDSSTDR